MNRLWLACFCALGFSGAAQAQVAQVLSGGCGTAGYSSTKGVASITQDTTGRECTASTATTTTPAIVGFGSLALTNASTLLSTLTIGPSSGAWATAGFVDVTNDGASAGTAYVCPLGGVCTSANGIPVAVGQSFRFSKPASTMTLISASTSTIYAQF